jgi:hypothetical protein
VPPSAPPLEGLQPAWKSEDPRLVSVSPDGRIRSPGFGTTEGLASLDGIDWAVTVRVDNPLRLVLRGQCWNGGPVSYFPASYFAQGACPSTPDPDSCHRDRRQVRTTLTEAGRALVTTLDPLVAEAQVQLNGHVTAEDLAALLRLLEKVGNPPAPPAHPHPSCPNRAPPPIVAHRETLQ